MRCWPRAIGLVILLALVQPPVVPAQDAAVPTAAPLTRAEMAAFLEHAKIVKSGSIPRGTTRPSRLTLSDGTLTHDAVFQSIDLLVNRQQFTGGRVEMNFRDSYRYNIAAYRLAELLGIGNMLPVTVERTWKGQKGSVSWWIDWKWDEVMRRKEDAHPPAELVIAYSNQLHLSRVFGQLVYDTDRNQTNTLVSADWTLYMVDFTRAFRDYDMLQYPDSVQRCSADLLQKLKALTRESVNNAVGSYLEPSAVTGLLKRRDKIVLRIEALIAERGEKPVLF